ncbi:MAG: hypothetical protein KDD72_08975 [Anaerolineales bacterium]|nr:hypothetical protein [Anaerolineales bacterium]
MSPKSEVELKYVNNELYLKSSLFGAWLGLIFGVILGAATGVLSGSWSGIQFGGVVGGVIGVVTGSLTGAITVRTAGTTGGVSIGAYTGMAFGALLGLILGLFLPESFRLSVLKLDKLILNVIFSGRFEAAILVSFLLSVLATAVGAWISGRNLKPRDVANLQ